MPTPNSLVYLASPLGFCEPGRHYYADVLLPAMAAAGLAVLDPWDDPELRVATALGVADVNRREAALRAANAALGARNAAMIRSSAGMLAILDGADADSGTAAEVGFAAALRLPIVGWRSDLRQTGELGSVVNLQVQWFIENSGGAIYREMENAIRSLARLLEA